jgi:hypothetical protein
MEEDAMSANAAPPPGPEGWQAQYLRLIAFPIQPAFERSREWWRELTGNDPQTSTEKRQRLEREDSGSSNGINLSLAVDLVRVQWTASVAVDPENLPEGIPAIGNFLERRDWFRDLMEQWLAGMGQPVKRLSFAASIVLPTESRQDAYGLLDRYLRCVDVDPNSTDFLYRVNRALPFSTVVDGLVINRLVAWAALLVMHYRQIMTGHALQAPERVRQGLHGVLLELDVNTAAERHDAIPQDRLAPLFAELTDLARDLARDGDRRP